MNCTIHTTNESALCRSCIEVGHCKPCGWRLSRYPAAMLWKLAGFRSLLLVVWVLLLTYGYTRLTHVSSNGPVYFFCLTGAILPLYLVLHLAFNSYLETGRVSGKQVGLVLLLLAVTVLLFQFVVVPLGRIDLD